MFSLGFLDEALTDLWLLALTLAFSSSIILIGVYLKSRGTPIGRNAFYVSLSSILWSVAAAFYAIPEIHAPEYSSNFIFLGLTSLAGATATLGAYERARIQSILSPSEGKPQDFRPWFIMSALALAVAFVEVLRFVLNIPFLNAVIDGPSLLSGLGFILIAGSLVALARPKFPDTLVYLGTGTALIIAIIVLIGYYLDIPALYAPLAGGATPMETAKGFIVASLGVALARQRGLKAWIIKINLAMGVLFIDVLAFIGYILHHPALLTFPTALCFFLVGVALFWRAWKTS